MDIKRVIDFSDDQIQTIRSGKQRFLILPQVISLSNESIILRGTQQIVVKILHKQLFYDYYIYSIIYLQDWG